MRILLPITACLLLAACSSTTPPPATTTPEPQAAASAHHLKTPWDSLLKDRDKAKAVQQKVDAYAKRQQQAIDQQSQ